LLPLIIVGWSWSGACAPEAGVWPLAGATAPRVKPPANVAPCLRSSRRSSRFEPIAAPSEKWGPWGIPRSRVYAGLGRPISSELPRRRCGCVPTESWVGVVDRPDFGGLALPSAGRTRTGGPAGSASTVSSTARTDTRPHGQPRQSWWRTCWRMRNMGSGGDAYPSPRRI